MEKALQELNWYEMYLVFHPRGTLESWSADIGVRHETLDYIWEKYEEELKGMCIRRLDILWMLGKMRKDDVDASLAAEWGVPHSTFSTRVNRAILVFATVLNEVR